MKTRLRFQPAMFAAGAALFLSVMACGVPGSTGAATPTLIVLPDASGGGAGQPTQASDAAQTEQAGEPPAPTKAFTGTAGEGAPLDLCTLATTEEVEAVIGGPVSKTSSVSGGQDCVLIRDDTHLLIVQAGHDADGKTLHLGGMEAQRDKVTDQSALQLLDDLKAQEASLTLPDLVRKGMPYWRAAGFTAEEEPGVGDWAIWFYGSQAGFGNLAEMGAGRASGAWLAVYTIAPDAASGKALLKPLLITLFSRLPDNFTITRTTN